MKFVRCCNSCNNKRKIDGKWYKCQKISSDKCMIREDEDEN